MDRTTTIQGTELLIKDYRGKRVVTFKDIDRVHQRPNGTARKRFNDNRKRFISGVDFYKISMSEFRTLGGIDDYNYPKGITLITESGYLMLVKSFTDDLAWKVQRDLVDTYFRARDEPETIQQTVTVTESVMPNIDNPGIYLEASKIMGSCLEGNRPYVLNILRHIIPDIDEVHSSDEQVETKVKVMNRYWRPGVEIDRDRLKLTLNYNHMTPAALACQVGVCETTVDNWITGKSRPLPENLIKICAVFGENEDFLKPKRKRNKK